MSGFKLCLNDIEHKFEKFSQISAYSLKAQWLSGLKLRLNDLFETYSTLRGWTDEVKIIRFSTSGLLPTVRGWADEAKIILFSTSGLLPIIPLIFNAFVYLIVFIVSKTRYNDNH